jgi:hypothetical protein
MDSAVLLRPSMAPPHLSVLPSPLNMVLLQLMVDLVAISPPDMVHLPVSADLEALTEHRAKVFQTESTLRTVDMITLEESTEDKETISL